MNRLKRPWIKNKPSQCDIASDSTLQDTFLLCGFRNCQYRDPSDSPLEKMIHKSLQKLVKTCIKLISMEFAEKNHSRSLKMCLVLCCKVLGIVAPRCDGEKLS